MAARHCFGAAAGLDGKVPPNSDLVLSIELLEVHPVDDLTPSGFPAGSLTRMIVTRGDGYDRPDADAQVSRVQP